MVLLYVPIILRQDVVLARIPVSCNLRWVATAVNPQCNFVPQAADQDYMWRRVQMSQQQSERQRKSLLQLCMLFHQRASQLQQAWERASPRGSSPLVPGLFGP